MGDDHRWAVVLAGGEGTRLRTATSRLHSDKRPKQFCAVEGTRTLLERTLERTALFARPERTLVSVLRQHSAWAPTAEWPSELIPDVQPTNRGTAPAALRTTLRIAERHEDAVVAVFPADHFVSDDAMFIETVLQAAAHVETHPHHLLCVGAQPTAPESNYGWLLPAADPPDPRCPHPTILLDGPSRDGARWLMAQAALWNTGVFVARAALLLRLFALTTPDWTLELTRLGAWHPTRMAASYRHLPTRDLWRDVIGCTRHGLYAVALGDVGWRELGHSGFLLGDGSGQRGRVA